MDAADVHRKADDLVSKPLHTCCTHTAEMLYRIEDQKICICQEPYQTLQISLRTDSCSFKLYNIHTVDVVQATNIHLVVLSGWGCSPVKINQNYVGGGTVGHNQGAH